MVDAGTQDELDDSPDRIGWRRLDEGLWAGRRDDRGVGTIEHLGRYVWVDAEGRPHSGRRTLQEAQDDAQSDAGPDEARSWRCPAISLGVVVGLAVLVAMVWMTGWSLLQP